MLSNLPEAILSARMFSGQGAPASERGDVLARFGEPREVVRALEAAADAGCGGVLTLGDETIVAALKRVRESRPDFQVLPIIPNVLGYVREATEHGLAGAGIRRLLRVGPVGFFRAGMRGALHAPQVLAKHFPTLLTILYELEMGEMRRFDPPVVFLHHQMTDLALAFGNRDVFDMFAERMRKRFGTEPGLATSNFAALARRLREWRVPISVIAAPVNRQGYLMPGGADAMRCEAERGDFQIVADKISPEMPTPDDAAQWAAMQSGVVSVVRDGVPEVAMV